MKPIAAAIALFCSALPAASLLAPMAHAQDFPSPDASTQPNAQPAGPPVGQPGGQPGAQSSASSAQQNPALNADAARSVHLWWEAPPAVAFANTLTIDQSVPGSYFMACGFSGGYFGLQELADKRHVVLFSVWDDAAGDDPGAVAQAQRVEVLAAGDGVEVSRFGGEGTGAKTMWPFAWKPGRPYTMLVRAVPDGDRVIYSAYISGSNIQGWKLMASLRARSSTKYLQGLYSFVEDFRRDGKSLQQVRRARFGSGWAKTEGSQWVSITQARFGADSNTPTNINARIESVADGPLRQQFFSLATGGLTRQSTPLGARLEIAPLQLPE